MPSTYPHQLLLSRWVANQIGKVREEKETERTLLQVVAVLPCLLYWCCCCREESRRATGHGVPLVAGSAAHGLTELADILLSWSHAKKWKQPMVRRKGRRRTRKRRIRKPIDWPTVDRQTDGRTETSKATAEQNLSKPPSRRSIKIKMQDQDQKEKEWRLKQSRLTHVNCLS